jgi:hypothetical protein
MPTNSVFEQTWRILSSAPFFPTEGYNTSEDRKDYVLRL